MACNHLGNQGFDAFLPLITKTANMSGKFLDTKAVSLNGVYRPILTHIVEGLRCRSDDDGVIQRLNNIISGNRVKIEQGPFAEFICTVESIQDDQRAWILIDLLQQKTRSAVSINDLSKIH